MCWQGKCLAFVIGGALATTVGAETAPSGSTSPVSLSLQPTSPESVYAPPAPPREDAGTNQGGVSYSLGVAYFTDYVFRGIEIFEPPGAEDRASVQIRQKLSFDLGKLPHPYIDAFVNYTDSDPISTFQEIRPTLGFDWQIKPIIISAGYTTYIYPDRDAFETSEVWGRLTIDDSQFLRTERPLLSPYIFGAYDIDLYNGWYFEAGVRHDFAIDELGLVVTADAHISYVRGFELFDATGGVEDADGFQHYQVGLTATKSLNTLFNFPTRYGTWSLQGFIYYTDGIDDDLLANTQIWGGMGILFEY